MKNHLRFLAFMLCALIALCGPLSVFAVAEEEDPAFSKFPETVTLKLGRSVDPNVAFEGGDSVEDNFYTRLLLETFNIKVEYEWLCAPADYDQKVNLAISSNSIPDALVVGLTPYRAMIKYDQIQDLTPTYENFASETYKYFYESGGEAIKSLTESDGKMMGLAAPAIRAGGFNTMWVRQDWLTALGLDVPETLDDVMEVAKAFVEKDPDGNGADDTIGISGPQKGGRLFTTGSNIYGFDPIFGAHQSFPGYWLEDEQGNVVYGSTQPETREALNTLSKMYADGLIDKEMMIRDDSLEPILSNKSGIFFGPWWVGYTIADNLNQEVPADWQAYAYPVADDGQYYGHMAAASDGYVVVNKNFEYPEAAMKIINLLIRDEAKWIAEGAYMANGMSAVYPLFSIFDGADEIEFSYHALNDLLAGEVDPETFDFTGHKLLQGDMVAVKELKNEPYDDFNVLNWKLDSEIKATNLPRLISVMIGGRPLATAENVVEVYSLTYSRTSTMESRWANLEKLEEETFTKIIMGQADISEFDRFVEDWHAQGGDKIIQEVTELTGK